MKEIISCVLRISSVKYQKSWSFLRWSLVQTKVNMRGMSGWRRPSQRTCWIINYRTSGWEVKTLLHTWSTYQHQEKHLALWCSLRFFVSLCRRAWTLCTGIWSRVVRSSLHCGLLRQGTATSLKATFGACPSGPASTCLSFLLLVSLRSSPCEISLMVQGTSGHSHHYWRNQQNILAAAQLQFWTIYCIYIMGTFRFQVMKL